MSHKAMKSATALLIMVLLLFGYTNCSQPNVNESSANPYDTLASSNGLLALSPANKTVKLGATLQITATGGHDPYTFRLRAGGGAIDYRTGIYSAPQTDTDSLIEVTDAAGNVAQTQILVRAQASGNLKLSYSPSPISLGSQVTMTASGGTAPYSYMMYSGVGSVSGNIYYASSFGAGVVLVRDAAGAESTFTLYVNSSQTYTLKQVYLLYHASSKQYLYSLNQTEGTSSGYALQGAAFRVIENTNILGTAALKRCFIASNGGRYLTTSGTCGSYTNEGTLGYIYTYQAENTVALYTCFRSSTGSYLNTKDYATCVNNGFNVQGTVGYVPQ